MTTPSAATGIVPASNFTGRTNDWGSRVPGGRVTRCLAEPDPAFSQPDTKVAP